MRTDHTGTITAEAALEVRDRYCRFYGCERPPSWCDAHHRKHWIDGGPTDLDNLILLCRRHHRMVHTQTTNTIDGTVVLC